MNDKLFISLETTLNGHVEETYINIDHILWFSKSAKVLKTSDGTLYVLTEDAVKKLEDVLQPV
jgi:hypothetical protein